MALVKTDVSEERSTSIIRVTGIDLLGKTLALTSKRRNLRRNFIDSCDSDDGGVTSLRNIGSYKSHARRRHSSTYAHVCPGDLADTERVYVYGSVRVRL
jgi:hypothetical protein